MTDNFFNTQETKEKLLNGMEKACSVIEGAYGAAGGNVMVEEPLYPFFRITNDGKAAIDKLKLSDPVENMGANVLKEASDKAERDSGDGRKTTMILTRAIVQGIKDAKESPLEIKRSLDACLPVILEAIDKQKKEISVDEVASVAAIASESEEIGRILQEVYQVIGKEGIVELEPSTLPHTHYEITEGVRVRGAGFLGDYSTTDGKGELAVYEKPKILVSKEKITSVEQVEPLYIALGKEGIKTLVIFADEVDPSVASRLAYNHIQGNFKTHIIKQPTLWKDLIVEDFCKVTGATPVDVANGKTFKNLALSDLGTCEKLISTREETRIIGMQDISEHVAKLKEDKSDESKLRLSWLQTKAAILKVGASSESELSYLLKKAKDGIAASYLALQDGVVPGGGVALANAHLELPDTIGGKILSTSLMAPIKQIQINAGRDVQRPPFTFIEKIFGAKRYYSLTWYGNMGYDARNNKFVDMWDAQILDPALVVKHAIRNAISIAGTLLTATKVVTLPAQEKNNQPHL